MEEDNQPSNSRNASIPDFIAKLYKMLMDSSLSNIVSWSAQGTSFLVKDPSEFSKYLLPLHFKHNNFASFVRQLNKYDFHKIKTTDDGKLYGSQAWEFYHALFQKEKPELLECIKRKTTQVKKSQPNLTPQSPFMKPLATNSQVKEIDALREQIFAMENVQNDMLSHLKKLTANYQQMMDQIGNFQKIITNQDQMIKELMTQSKNSAKPDNMLDLAMSQLGSTMSFSGYPEATNQLMSNSSLLQVQNNTKNQAVKRDDLETFLNRYASNETFKEPKLTTTHHLDSLDQLKKLPASMQSTQASLSTPLFQSLDLYRQPCTTDSVNNTFSTQPNSTTDTASQQNFQNSNETKIPSTVSCIAPESTPASQVTPHWLAPPKVLLVEDDDTCRRLSSKLLQIFGCNFDIAVDGIDAVNRMVGYKYDIVLMDIVMPNLDGVSATTRIRQFDQSTPIISMTSNITETDCLTYLANGMNDILAKPFNKSTLLGMILRYCAHRSITHGFNQSNDSKKITELNQEKETERKAILNENANIRQLESTGQEMQLMDLLGMELLNGDMYKETNRKRLLEESDMLRPSKRA